MNGESTLHCVTPSDVITRAKTVVDQPNQEKKPPRCSSVFCVGVKKTSINTRRTLPLAEVAPVLKQRKFQKRRYPSPFLKTVSAFVLEERKSQLDGKKQPYPCSRVCVPLDNLCQIEPRKFQSKENLLSFFGVWIACSSSL